MELKHRDVEVNRSIGVILIINLLRHPLVVFANCGLMTSSDRDLQTLL